jgi:hypothetical protein
MLCQPLQHPGIQADWPSAGYHSRCEAGMVGTAHRRSGRPAERLLQAGFGGAAARYFERIPSGTMKTATRAIAGPSIRA